MLIANILSFLDGEEIPFVFTGDAGIEVNSFSSLNRYKGGAFHMVQVAYTATV